MSGALEMKPVQAVLIDRALISPPDRIEITCGSGVKPVRRVIVRNLGSALASCAAAGAAAARQRSRQQARYMDNSPGLLALSKRNFGKSSALSRESAPLLCVGG